MSDLAIDEFMVNDAMISRDDRISDGHGGWVKSERVVATERAMISTPSGGVGDGMIGDREQARPVRHVYFVSGVDCRRGDWIDVLGRRYRVTTTETNAEETYLVAICEEAVEP